MSGASKTAAPIFEHLKHDVPNPKQILFFKSEAKHTAYGGARGGGKSWAGRRKAVMLCMAYPGITGLILRRTMPELRENHIIPLQQELHGYAKYRSDDKAFLFPNGSRLRLGYCDNDNDQMQYQGAEVDFIVFEEATNFKEEWIRFICSSMRNTKTNFRTRFYYTMNPGGVSHGYFKRLFIDRNFMDGENPDDYYFIPATVQDNKVLMENDPDYIKILEALPPAKRRAHLYGDWDVYEGQVFEEFRNLQEHYIDRKGTHVIEPFEIPPEFTIYRAMDWGYSKPFAVTYFAVDYDGRAYLFLEYYGCVKDEPDTGVKMTPDEVFKEIQTLEHQHKWLKGKDIKGVADPAIWNKETGISVAETGEKYHIYFEKGDNQRVAGWLQMHERFKFDENGVPMMYIFKNCKNVIRTLPILQYDEHKVEDVNTKQEDHLADSIRYFCNMMPLKPQKPIEPKERPYNPLDDEETNKSNNSYNYYIKYL